MKTMLKTKNVRLLLLAVAIVLQLGVFFAYRMLVNVPQSIVYQAF